MPGQSDGVIPPSIGEILAKLGRFGINPSLDRVRFVLETLGHPEKKCLTFQIVGTNGKGSTAAAIDSILQAAGYRTGRYTSPHLIDVRERILIAGQLISRTLFEDLVRSLDALCAKIPIDLTFFEFLTVVAFLAFSRSGCQVVVLEAGMGGRWDATTVSDPCVTVLTQVARDHEEVLGKGVERIFEEKVAVGRKGRPFVATLSDTVLRRKFLDHARMFQFIPVLNQRDFKGEWISADNVNGAPRPFRFGGRWGVRQMVTTLSATYQLDNLLSAVTALEWSPLPIPLQAFREGLLTLSHPGRLEQVRNDPPTLLDGAHNPAGVSALCLALRDRFGTKTEFGFFIGIHAAKDWKEMLEIFAREGRTFFFPDAFEEKKPTLSINGAWVPPWELATLLKQSEISKKETVDIYEGDGLSLLDKATAWAKNPNRILVVTGSLYLVGSVRNILCPPTDPPLFTLNERDLPGSEFS